MLVDKWYSRLSGRLLVLALVSLASTTMAQDLNSSGYWISEADIAKELGAVGVSVDASQIHLPVHMSAAGASPKLEFVTAQPLGSNQVRLELRCATTSNCLPFFATLDVKDANVVSAAIRLKASVTAHPSHPSESQGKDRNDQESPRIAVSSALEDRPKMKVGSRAVLEIREGRMDIHLQVLAIDTGTIGQQVRVCTLDRRKVFRAIVTGEGTVTGVLE